MTTRETLLQQARDGSDATARDAERIRARLPGALARDARIRMTKVLGGIAIALATAGLDAVSRQDVWRRLAGKAAEGVSIVVSTHDLGILPIHFSRAVFIDRQVVADGPVGEVLTAETLARAYGVELCVDGKVTLDRVAH